MIKRKKRKSEKSEELKELEMIKKLLALHLIKCGAKPTEIRNILNISGTNFKKLFQNKKIKTYEDEKNVTKRKN